MKKLMILSAILFSLGIFSAKADNDRMITVNQLPQKSQEFVKQHFPNEKVAYAKFEREFLDSKYEIVFTNSAKIEYSTVPAAIIPQQIATYVKQNYPDASIVKIDRDKRDYEVKLTNRLELTFDLNFNLIEIDD